MVNGARYNLLCENFWCAPIAANLHLSMLAKSPRKLFWILIIIYMIILLIQNRREAALLSCYWFHSISFAKSESGSNSNHHDAIPVQASAAIGKERRTCGFIWENQPKYILKWSSSPSTFDYDNRLSLSWNFWWVVTSLWRHYRSSETFCEVLFIMTSLLIHTMTSLITFQCIRHNRRDVATDVKSCVAVDPTSWQVSVMTL